MEKGRETAFPPGAGRPSYRAQLWGWAIGTSAVLLILMGLLLPRVEADRASAVPDIVPDTAKGGSGQPVHPTSRLSPIGRITPEAVVARKVTEFARNRSGLLKKIPGASVLIASPEVQAFFDAAESGDWPRAQEAYKRLEQWRKGKMEAGEQWSEEMERGWPAILETYGVVEAAHAWPARALLDYGEAVLGSLQPGTVYIGGTDAGRFIPTLLNETSGGERHVVLTQNALADRTYLEYLQFLYGDRIKTLTGDDSTTAFQEYLADGQRRALHDRDFPDQKPQLRPGENIVISDNRVQVSGQVAVMSINEKLLSALMNKNPGLSFVMEESFPLESLYADALPAGPLLELRAGSARKAVDAGTAARVVDFWRDASTQFASASPDTSVAVVRDAYAKMAAAQATWLAKQNFGPEAELAYGSALEIAPANVEVVTRYANLLISRNKQAEALTVAEGVLRAAPDNEGLSALVRALREKTSQSQTPGG